MLTTSEIPIEQTPFAQAIELSLLVDLEARWENLRMYQPESEGMPSTIKELHQKQKAVVS